MLKIGLVLLLCLVVSCGKSGSSKDPGSTISGRSPFVPASIPGITASPLPLSGKSDQEILKLKYDNQVELRCAIRVNQGAEVDLKSLPKDELVWTVPQEKDLLKILNFKIGNRPFVVVVRLATPLEFFDNVSHTDENHKEYFMEHTPVLKILFRRGQKVLMFNRGVHRTETFSERTLYENVEESLYTTTTQVGRDTVTEEVRCTLMTKIKSEYSNQWRIIK